MCLIYLNFLFLVVCSLIAGGFYKSDENWIFVLNVVAVAINAIVVIGHIQPHV